MLGVFDSAFFLLPLLGLTLLAQGLVVAGFFWDRYPLAGRRFGLYGLSLLAFAAFGPAWAVLAVQFGGGTAGDFFAALFLFLGGSALGLAGLGWLQRRLSGPPPGAGSGGRFRA